MKYRRWFWKCSKCRSRRHRASYIGHNNTMYVTCEHCRYQESLCV